jgi:fructose-1,6-bisphosphatase/inositol monophosphatase family enzyme
MLPPDLAIGTLRIARDLVAGVGGQLLAMSSTLRASSSKEGVDVVTAADGFSEQALTAALAQHFPDHRIAAEEGTRLGPAASPWCWHLDPLDGTANYSRGIPHWAISLGLAFQDTPVLGVVHGPACGITVSGIAGLGAWAGDAPLPRATPAGEPKTWIIATDWPWDLAERQRTNRLLERLSGTIRQYKTFGSAALDLAAVAMGVVDAYAISKVFPWDQAGGAAACAALGLELRRWNGDAWDLRFGDLVACRPGMWPVLAGALR